MPHTQTDDIQTTLGLNAAGQRRGRRGRWMAAIVLLLVGAGALAVWRRAQRVPPVRYQTTAVQKTTLRATISATGELNAMTQVSVGTEISGIVETVTVDFNSPVRIGQVLARVNTEKLEAQAAQARASLLSAEAKHRQAQATLAEGQANLARFRQVRELSGGKVPSQQEFDAQDATVKRAQADEASAAAGVTQARASLSAIETDIRKAVIKSPINGIVLNRAVDPGQTVAASFQTPTLFTVAEDLTKMKLIISVDEADIGQVRTGQHATFRVDAYPDQLFESAVREVRSTPQTSNGVVTYPTVLTVDNAERLLQPGMTATAEITVTEVRDALVVPNAALRFTPPETQRPAAQGGFLPRPPASQSGDRSADAASPRVWTLVDNKPVEVRITLGATDGRVTEVKTGNLQVGALVITDLVTTPVK